MTNRIPDGEKKTKAVIIRMSESEKIHLDKVAKQEKMSVATFIKWLVGKFDRGMVG